MSSCKLQHLGLSPSPSAVSCNHGSSVLTSLVALDGSSLCRNAVAEARTFNPNLSKYRSAHVQCVGKGGTSSSRRSNSDRRPGNSGRGGSGRGGPQGGGRGNGRGRGRGRGAPIGRPAQGPKERVHERQKQEVEVEMPGTLSRSGLRVVQEVVLQPEEPAGAPHWNTFASSLAGMWGGVAAAFNPLKGSMEALDIAPDNEYLYDAASRCEVVSGIEYVQGGVSLGRVGLHRRVTWEAGNAELAGEDDSDPSDEDNLELAKPSEAVLNGHDVLGVDSAEHYAGDDGEEQEPEGEVEVEVDVMGPEPGVVYFEDGSYSRGPTTLLSPDDAEEASTSGAEDDSANGSADRREILPNTVKIEQCLVRGGHRRLRMNWTLLLGEGGASLNVLRMLAFEEEWLGPAHMAAISDEDGSAEVLPFSLQPRLQERELAGSWKVFERHAFVIRGSDDEGSDDDESLNVIYTSSECLRERPSPPSSTEDDGRKPKRMEDGLLFLPGGISTSLVVGEKGGLCIGVGWLTGDGTRLFMERVYDDYGELVEVCSGTEILGDWVGGRM